MENFENIKEKITSGEYTTVKKTGRSEVYNIFMHPCYKKYKKDKESNNIKVQPDYELKKMCLQLVVQWVVGNCRPFNIVNDDGLHNLVEFILQTGHSYGKNIDFMKLLPHSTTVSRNIAILYQTQHVILKEELLSIKDNGFAITCDLWKDDFLKRTYIGATAHYIKDGSLSHKVLAMRGMDNLKNTGHNIRIKMENILKDFGCELNHLVRVVTDRGSNMKTAFSNEQHIFCINHLLNNVIEKAIADVEEVKTMSCECAKVVKYFKKAGINSSLHSTLKSYTPTRWNTIYFLLESIKQNWTDITRMLEEKDEYRRISHLNLGTINDIVEILKPFEESSRLLEAENYPTLHHVIPQIHKLKSICRQTSYSEITRKFKERLLHYLETLVASNIFDVHRVALFLFPPANKLHHFEQNDVEQIHEECIKMAKHYENSSSDSSSNDVEDTNIEEDAFSFFVQSSALLGQREGLSNNEITRYIAKTVLYYKDFNLLNWLELHKTSPIVEVNGQIVAVAVATSTSFSNGNRGQVVTTANSNSFVNVRNPNVRPNVQNQKPNQNLNLNINRQQGNQAGRKPQGNQNKPHIVVVVPNQQGHQRPQQQQQQHPNQGRPNHNNNTNNNTNNNKANINVNVNQQTTTQNRPNKNNNNNNININNNVNQPQQQVPTAPIQIQIIQEGPQTSMVTNPQQNNFGQFPPHHPTGYYPRPPPPPPPYPYRPHLMPTFPRYPPPNHFGPMTAQEFGQPQIPFVQTPPATAVGVQDVTFGQMDTNPIPNSMAQLVQTPNNQFINSGASNNNIPPALNIPTSAMQNPNTPTATPNGFIQTPNPNVQGPMNLPTGANNPSTLISQKVENPLFKPEPSVSNGNINGPIISPVPTTTTTTTKPSVAATISPSLIESIFSPQSTTTTAKPPSINPGAIVNPDSPNYVHAPIDEEEDIYLPIDVRISK
ncbi:uncharacterized protein [Musca autumnalis]|uniref:uncharacterized protein n=1 Tax=Musca autumnalis TaxID=221902 RepID=UPI003CF8270F